MAICTNEEPIAEMESVFKLEAKIKVKVASIEWCADPAIIPGGSSFVANSPRMRGQMNPIVEYKHTQPRGNTMPSTNNEWIRCSQLKHRVLVRFTLL